MIHHPEINAVAVRDDVPEALPVACGVPLGGMGAGAVEWGADGRFRNITINNNRESGSGIPVSAHSFLAVRTATPERIYSRILQQEFSPQDEATESKRLPRDLYDWQGLYPRSDFRLNDPACPAKISWSGFFPFIPYDYEASSLPLFFAGVQVVNPTAEPLDVAVLFCWENLCGHALGITPPQWAPIEAVPLRVQERRHEMESPAGEETDEAEVLNALRFGANDAVRTDHDGEYCLAVQPHEGTEIDLLAWDPEHLGDWRTFWNAFRLKGSFSGVTMLSDRPRCGVVCNSFRLAPGEEYRVDFVLAWHCPQFVRGRANQGNVYANKFPNALEVARHGLRNIGYFSSSVEAWHRRYLLSSLPPWFTRLLLNSSHIFTTNTLRTRAEGFGMAASPTTPHMAPVDLRLFYSLGLLLFFPRLEAQEMEEIATAKNPHAAELLCAHLGEMCLHRPEYTGDQSDHVVRTAHIVLSAYRDFVFTGSLTHVQSLFAKLQAAMANVLAMDVNRDGLPDLSERTRSYDGIEHRGLSSYAASLWVAATRAFALLSLELRTLAEGERYKRVHVAARQSFERLYWDEGRGYYRFAVVAGEHGATQDATCHLGQLAGQWYADFLQLGLLFPRRNILSAIEAMQRALEGAEVEWPSLSTIQLACLQIRHNDAGLGLASVERQYQRLRHTPGHLFNPELAWGLLTENDRRHSSTLSIWYVLQALQGVSMHVPKKRLTIWPRTPREQPFPKMPIVLPSCMGHLEFREEHEGLYKQIVQLSFDSPVTITSIRLKLPPHIRQCSVACELDTGPLKLAQEIKMVDGELRLTLSSRRPFNISSQLSIEVVERIPEPAAKRFRFWK